MTDQATQLEDRPAELPGAGGLLPAGEGTIVPASHEHDHPEPRQYVLIAVVLVIATGIEIATSYLDGEVNSTLVIFLLGVLAAVKFFLVVAWYMHLKSDKPILRRFFYIGLGAAPVLYLIVAFTFHSFARGS